MPLSGRPVPSPGRWWHGALAIVLTVVLGACANGPTAPSSADAGGSLVVGARAEGPPAAQPEAVIPTPGQALGATRFLAFGDSITAGALSEFDNVFVMGDEAWSYPRVLQVNLNASHAPQVFTMLNAGVPGETARAGVDRMPGVLNSFRPQVVLLLEGINDLNFGVSIEQTAANVHQMVQIARLFNCTVLVATMPQTYHSIDPNTGRERFNSTEKIVPYNNEIRRLVAGMPNVHVVDVYAAFGSNRAYMGGDGLHPTLSGYQRMAQEFLGVVRAVFPVRGSLQ